MRQESSPVPRVSPLTVVAAGPPVESAGSTYLSQSLPQKTCLPLFSFLSLSFGGWPEPECAFSGFFILSLNLPSYVPVRHVADLPVS